MSDETDTAFHTRQIERHTAMLRGEEPEPPLSPDDFRIPSGEALRSMRETCGLTTAEVADRVGKTRQTIYAVERQDSRPGFGLLVALLRLYRREWPADAEVPR
jgi:DNA-binding XRE family transcriptional regulator